jgi:hypothetical protein
LELTKNYSTKETDYFNLPSLSTRKRYRNALTTFIFAFLTSTDTTKTQYRFPFTDLQKSAVRNTILAVGLVRQVGGKIRDGVHTVVEIPEKTPLPLLPLHTGRHAWNTVGLGLATPQLREASVSIGGLRDVDRSSPARTRLQLACVSGSSDTTPMDTRSAMCLGRLDVLRGRRTRRTILGSACGTHVSSGGGAGLLPQCCDPYHRPRGARTATRHAPRTRAAAGCTPRHASTSRGRTHGTCEMRVSKDERGREDG